ncbi:hypothetical protein ACP1S1_000690 [Escherichia coli]|nr:hypothetical protein [Escherichia coli]
MSIIILTTISTTQENK